jgi:PhnB protein
MPAKPIPDGYEGATPYLCCKNAANATSVMIYFEDVDPVFERAVSAGAKVLQPVTDQFYGDRSCKLQDPSGHTWMFATHKEDAAPDELKRRAEAMFGGG